MQLLLELMEKICLYILWVKPLVRTEYHRDDYTLIRDEWSSVNKKIPTPMCVRDHPHGHSCSLCSITHFLLLTVKDIWLEQSYKGFKVRRWKVRNRAKLLQKVPFGMFLTYEFQLLVLTLGVITLITWNEDWFLFKQTWKFPIVQTKETNKTLIFYFISIHDVPYKRCFFINFSTVSNLMC